MEFTYHSQAHFVRRRGLALCLLFEAMTFVFLFRAGRAGADADQFYAYAHQFLSAALSSFACALPGSLLMEDMLRYLER